MALLIHKQSLETAYRNWIIGQAPSGVYVVTGVNGTTPANTAIIEVPWVFRTSGAVQIVGTGLTGTIKVQGTLLDGSIVADYTNGPRAGTFSFLVPSTDADYADLASVSASGITQVTGRYQRIRVICSALAAGTFEVRVF